MRQPRWAVLAAFFYALLFPISTAVRAEESGKLGERYVEKEGGYSFKPPKYWSMAPIQGLKYQMARAPAINGFSPNIDVVDETYGATVDEYAALNLKSLASIFKDYKEVSRDVVILDSGARAIRVVITDMQANFAMRQSFYFMAGPKSTGKMLVVTCSALAEKGDAWDDTFERSVKTFVVDK